MNRRNFCGIASSFIGGLAMFVGHTKAQQPSEIEAIKAAHLAFYAALSAKDAKAMEAVWAKKPYVVTIGPASKTVAVGYADAVANYWPATFERFSELSSSVTSIAQIQTDGKLAWVVGTEGVVGKRKNGEPLKYSALFTDIFEKDGDRWFMVSHQAQRIPE